MPKKINTTEVELELSKEVKALTKEITKLKELEFVKILKQPWRMLGLSFLKGVMVGFGSVLGATVVVALFLFLLSKISFVPVVGDFVEKVIQEVQVSHPSSTK